MTCSAGRSCVTRAHQPSWRGPTVEPWSSPLCSASPRWSTSWAWVNSSSASCPKKTTKKAPPLCLFASPLPTQTPIPPTMHHTEDSHLIPKRNPSTGPTRGRPVHIVSNSLCWMSRWLRREPFVCQAACRWQTQIPAHWNWSHRISLLLYLLLDCDCRVLMIWVAAALHARRHLF